MVTKKVNQSRSGWVVKLGVFFIFYGITEFFRIIPCSLSTFSLDNFEVTEVAQIAQLL